MPRYSEPEPDGFDEPLSDGDDADEERDGEDLPECDGRIVSEDEIAAAERAYERTLGI